LLSSSRIEEARSILKFEKSRTDPVHDPVHDDPVHEAVLDDASARRCAMVFGIPMRGSLSFVALAKKRGFVPACRPVFVKMLAAGLHVPPALIEQVALAAGE